MSKPGTSSAKKSVVILDIASLFGANGDEVTEPAIEFLKEHKNYISRVIVLHQKDEPVAEAVEKISEEVVASRSVKTMLLPGQHDQNFDAYAANIATAARIADKRHYEGLVIVTDPDLGKDFRDAGFETCVAEVLNPNDAQDPAFAEIGKAIVNHATSMANANGRPALYRD